MKEHISVMVNGVTEKVPRGKSLLWLKDILGEKDANMIVERNGVFVYPQQYDSVFVEDGDTIEFINPDFGG